MNRQILLIVIVLLLIGSIIYLCKSESRWTCSEGQCEKMLEGECSSLKQCKETCESVQMYVNGGDERRKIQNRRQRANKVNISKDFILIKSHR